MRKLGDFRISTNYEVLSTGPFDARMLTELKSDLTDASQWTTLATYAGMIVSVAGDTEDNNGVYVLKQKPITNESNWVKLFDNVQFEEFSQNLQEQLEQYVSNMGYSKIHVGELPETGDENTIYFRELDGNWEEYIWTNSMFVLIGSNAGDLSNYYTKEEIDGKISSLESQIQNVQSSIPDVSQFITNTVDNLVNYYTKTEVDDKISQITSSSFLVVDSLPQTGESNIIYLVAKSSAEPQNGYNEYIYVNGNWELIGETTIDLSDYVTSEQLTAELANYALSSAIPTALSQLTNDEGFVTISDVQSLLDSYVTENELETELSTKQDTLVSGTNIKTINGYSILGEGNIQIQGGSGGDISIATEDTVGGILATDNSTVEGVEAFVDVDDTGKASVKIPSVDETSTPDDVVNLLNTSTLILNGNA